MSKAKKSAKKHSRQRSDWPLFFKHCNQGKDNEQIAKALGWKIDPKSADPFKRVRAAKSLARTKGFKVDGKLVRLYDRKLKGVEKPKAVVKKRAVRKPKAKPITTQNEAKSDTSKSE